MEEVITVNGLAKSYGDVEAVTDVSLGVRRAEIFGLLGPNGSGKTTTVEILQGLRSRDGGEVSVLGHDPGPEGERLRRRIGSQLQSAALPARLRVGEAVQLFAALIDRPVDADAVMAEWKLSSLRKRPFAVLSGGQKQRLFLALALLGDPEVVFLDELTTGLDPQARRSTWDLIRKVRDRGTTVVLVTHFMEEAEALCDRVAIIDAGRTVAVDTPVTLSSRRGGAVRMSFTTGGANVDFLRGVPGVDQLAQENGTAVVVGTAPSVVGVASALRSAGVEAPDFRTRYPTLEDVFLSITGRSLRDREENR